jgi:hypothetical protein
MTFRNDNPFAGFELAEHLRDCITPYLAGTTSGLPARVCITTGEIAWDECECGQLVVALDTAYESASFPNPWDATANSGSRKCGPPLFIFQYTVSMLRCSPVSGDNGEPPPCAAVDAAARVTVEDAWAVRAGLMCCLCTGSTRQPDGTKLFESYTLGPQVMVGPMGACQGSAITVTIGVPNGGYPCGVS